MYRAVSRGEAACQHTTHQPCTRRFGAEIEAEALRPPGIIRVGARTTGPNVRRTVKVGSEPEEREVAARAEVVRARRLGARARAAGRVQTALRTCRTHQGRGGRQERTSVSKRYSRRAGAGAGCSGSLRTGLRRRHPKDGDVNMRPSIMPPRYREPIETPKPQPPSKTDHRLRPDTPCWRVKTCRRHFIAS
jgi:hypothetical protein